MKVLLDENIDVRLKKAFQGTEHDVFTIQDMGWQGTKNGELLQKMRETAFDILVAVDKICLFNKTERFCLSLFISLMYIETCFLRYCHLFPSSWNDGKFPSTGKFLS